MTSFRSGGTWG